VKHFSLIGSIWPSYEMKLVELKVVLTEEGDCLTSAPDAAAHGAFPLQDIVLCATV
jgi:hypothetical protein